MGFSLSNSFMGSSSANLPFWLWANQDGKINPAVSFLNLTELGVKIDAPVKERNDFRYTVGADIVVGMGKESYFQTQQLFAGIDYKGWEINAGMFYDSLRFEGLSTTNGNLAQSRNARPYPKVRISTSHFKPVPLLEKWLSFSFEYDEGILSDERYVSQTHLHHKSLHLKMEPITDWSLQVGAEHFVMWGGTSTDNRVGAMPSNFNAYLRYISGSSGGDDFPETDQLNVAGNQYGTYQILISKEFTTYSASLNISHPFDDFSGVNWRNWPDNLIGLNIKLKDKDKFITHLLYEFTNTRQQSITDSLYMWNDESQAWKRMENDSYYNHGVYKSGVTFHQMAMGSPLFAPVTISDGISRGFGSTRFYSHHMGASGNLSNEIAWKSLITFIQHWGNYGNTYQPYKNQLSCILHLNYYGKLVPFKIGLSLAADNGTFYENKVGAQLRISKSW